MDSWSAIEAISRASSRSEFMTLRYWFKQRERNLTQNFKINFYQLDGVWRANNSLRSELSRPSPALPAWF
jgi:hypothetical protein